MINDRKKGRVNLTENTDDWVLITFYIHTSVCVFVYLALFV